LKKIFAIFVLIIAIAGSVCADSWSDLQRQRAINSQNHGHRYYKQGQSYSANRSYDGWSGNHSSDYYEGRLKELKQIRERIRSAIGQFRLAKSSFTTSTNEYANMARMDEFDYNSCMSTSHTMHSNVVLCNDNISSLEEDLDEINDTIEKLEENIEISEDREDRERESEAEAKREEAEAKRRELEAAKRRQEAAQIREASRVKFDQSITNAESRPFTVETEHDYLSQELTETLMNDEYVSVRWVNNTDKYIVIYLLTCDPESEASDYNPEILLIEGYIDSFFSDGWWGTYHVIGAGEYKTYFIYPDSAPRWFAYSIDEYLDVIGDKYWGGDEEYSFPGMIARAPDNALFPFIQADIDKSIGAQNIININE
jgi:hypothetical protein